MNVFSRARRWWDSVSRGTVRRAVQKNNKCIKRRERAAVNRGRRRNNGCN